MVASGVCDGKFGGVSEGVVRDDNSVDVVVAAACASSPPPPPDPPIPSLPGGVRASREVRGSRHGM